MTRRLDRFGEEHAAFRARMERNERVIRRVWWMMLVAIVVIVGWGLTHPEAIGRFLGRIASGFNAASR